MDNRETYYKRMASSLGDKVRILEHLGEPDQSKRILDVGSGGGELLAELQHYGTAQGIDTSPESVDRANMLSNGSTTLGYADQTTKLFGENYFDAIVCSSVLHEAFSYGTSTGNKRTIKALYDTIYDLYTALKPGGTFIIRDGVNPGYRLASMRVDNPDAVAKFLENSPYTYAAEHARDNPIDRSIYLGQDPNDPHVFRGTQGSIMEFAFTYTWGEESFNREVQEFYGLWTLGEYAAWLEGFGFTIAYATQYVQDDYRKHLEGKVDFIDMDFPASNAIIVATKKP